MKISYFPVIKYCKLILYALTKTLEVFISYEGQIIPLKCFICADNAGWSNIYIKPQNLHLNIADSDFQSLISLLIV